VSSSKIAIVHARERRWGSEKKGTFKWYTGDSHARSASHLVNVQSIVVHLASTTPHSPPRTPHNRDKTLP
jgi:hypothetical protein